MKQTTTAPTPSPFANLPLTERPPLLAPQRSPYTWVTLRHPPTAFSFDEAWLLCRLDSNHWLAWIPDYGEIRLQEDDIY
jgi:hypothetical protein